jgi:hypothetical protein
MPSSTAPPHPPTHSCRVHRDISLENVLLRHKTDGSGRLEAMLSDFGFAAFLPLRDGLDSPCATKPSPLDKSLFYLPPEVLQPGSQRHLGPRVSAYTPAADMFGLGRVLYTLLVGNFVPGQKRRAAASTAAAAAEAAEADAVVQQLTAADPRQRLSAAQLLAHSWLQQGSSLQRLAASGPAPAAAAPASASASASAAASASASAAAAGSDEVMQAAPALQASACPHTAMDAELLSSEAQRAHSIIASHSRSWQFSHADFRDYAAYLKQQHGSGSAAAAAGPGASSGAGSGLGRASSAALCPDDFRAFLSQKMRLSPVAVAELMGDGLAASSRESLFQLLDRDHSGTIEWQELLLILPLLGDSPHLEELPPETLRLYFDVFAHPQTHRLGEMELCHMLVATGFARSFAAELEAVPLAGLQPPNGSFSELLQEEAGEEKRSALQAVQQAEACYRPYAARLCRRSQAHSLSFEQFLGILRPEPAEAHSWKEAMGEALTNLH